MNRRKSVLIVVGTRPEAIKLAPVILALAQIDDISITVCTSGQHEDMVEPALAIFGITPDKELSLGHPARGSLTKLYSELCLKLGDCIEELKPDYVIVHGDTLTTTAASMSAFFHGIPVAHIEAGLRSKCIREPWPEEFNRRVVSVATQIHFCPTQISEQNLLQEGISEKSIQVTGNTIIDALEFVRNKNKSTDTKSVLASKIPFTKGKKLVLVTAHRRENQGAGLEGICDAITSLTTRGDVEFLFPVHPNKVVSDVVHKKLGNNASVHLCVPFEYDLFVEALEMSDVILTDSGGIQEEAAHLGKPVAITRQITERPEVLLGGNAVLAGTVASDIVQTINQMLDEDKETQVSSETNTAFGDGTAAKQIAEWFKEKA